MFRLNDNAISERLKTERMVKGKTVIFSTKSFEGKRQI